MRIYKKISFLLPFFVTNLFIFPDFLKLRMSNQNPKDEIITLPYKELKNLEIAWLKKIKNKSGFWYGHEKKEFIKSLTMDLRKIANQTLKKD